MSYDKNHVTLRKQYFYRQPLGFVWIVFDTSHHFGAIIRDDRYHLVAGIKRSAIQQTNRGVLFHQISYGLDAMAESRVRRFVDTATCCQSELAHH